VSAARTLLGEFVAARDAGLRERVAQLLRDDIRYWDCKHGELTGREAVAASLTAADRRVALETIAVAGADAVLELQLEAPGGRYRSTEVYRLEADGVASIKAYFDPDAEVG
jgi:hypothetical protein